MSYEGYSISVHFACSAIKAAQRSGLDEQALLQEAGIGQRLLDNAQMRMTSLQFSRLMLALWRVGDDEFMGLAPYRSRHGVFALMARQVIGCRRLASVYYRMARFYNLVNDSLRLELTADGGQTAFVMRLADPERDSEHLLREVFMLLWHRFASWLVGQRIGLREVHFDYPQPANHAEYRLMFPCPARFSMPDCRLVLDPQCLDMPVVQTPATLREHLRRAPLEWFTRPSYQAAFTRSVSDLFQHDGAFRDLGIEAAAEALHITERTLRRRLALEGVRFQALKDGLRRDLAIHYLSQAGLPISEIAQRLGFSEPSAFTRAFRQWTGDSPRAYREAARA
ncbi:AraC family transcriptional regulator [Stutzerimonas balearica]|jgi:AraC-like DNA-binding protein|uniref:AraC family transcriptional regulator n=1 Tax=Stutzerimonas balearica TaxID=74829 RepID=A0A9X7V3Z3_9GAMM|nr:AraC family transcriptional regulator [Stutzerimonas balearica]QQN51568.1 AraC family transcriptional regulator [Stutzerimonas balearica]